MFLDRLPRWFRSVVLHRTLVLYHVGLHAEAHHAAYTRSNTRESLKRRYRNFSKIWSYGCYGNKETCGDVLYLV